MQPVSVITSLAHTLTSSIARSISLLNRNVRVPTIFTMRKEKDIMKAKIGRMKVTDSLKTTMFVSEDDVPVIQALF